MNHHQDPVRNLLARVQRELPDELHDPHIDEDAMKTDIADTVDATLGAIVRQAGAELFRLEFGTLMMRHPESLDTRFYHDEEDALGQLRGAKPLKRRLIKRRPTSGKSPEGADLPFPDD
jgi:hypothetical protein